MNTFLTTPELMGRWKVSRVTLWEWRKKNLIPSPVRLGYGLGPLRWRLSDIEAYEAKKAA